MSLSTATVVLIDNPIIVAMAEAAKRGAPAPPTAAKAVPAIPVIVATTPASVPTFPQVSAIPSRTCIAVPRLPLPYFNSLSSLVGLEISLKSSFHFAQNRGLIGAAKAFTNPSPTPKAPFATAPSGSSPLRKLPAVSSLWTISADCFDMSGFD